MKVAGIIAEYNPFHNGHAYHIERVRKQTGADYVIAIISGDFVQRGAPAMADKYLRAKMALLGGADLVMELPVCAATASAETFARTGVNILSQSGIVTHLGFGCETDDLPLLTAIADLFLKEPETFKESLSSYLKSGFSFPAARAKAAEEYFNAAMLHSNDGGNAGSNPSARPEILHTADISRILNNPNNILAIEYLKALKLSGSDMIPCAILRKGSDYHSTDFTDAYCSATSIRGYLDHNAGETGPSMTQTEKQLRKMIPAPCAGELLAWLEKYPPITENDLSSLLHYRLLLNRDIYYKENSQLGNRIENLLELYTSFSDFVQLLKTKDRTYTAVSRHLLHILLGIDPAHMTALEATDYAPYIRILGFKKDSSPLLRVLKRSHIPVLTRLAEDSVSLNEKQKLLLDADIRSAHIYQSVLTAKTGIPFKSEYRHPLVYL